MSVQIGPFFCIKNKLIRNTCSLEKGRRQADKLDNSYSHEQLWDDHFDSGEYIDHPRGRVVWDCTNNRAIIYIDRCISKPEVISKITEAFELNDYSVEFDDHYRCRDCTEDFLGNYDNAGIISGLSKQPVVWCCAWKGRGQQGPHSKISTTAT